MDASTAIGLTVGLVAVAVLVVLYVRWLRSPGDRDLKLFVTGGWTTLFYDRSRRARGREPSVLGLLALGGPDALLVQDEEERHNEVLPPETQPIGDPNVPLTLTDTADHNSDVT